MSIGIAMRVLLIISLAFPIPAAATTVASRLHTMASLCTPSLQANFDVDSVAPMARIGIANRRLQHDLWAPRICRG